MDTLNIVQARAELVDPHVWTDDRSRLNLRFAVYDALVRYDGHGGNRPALAESWTLDADARTWTFALRPGVTFHNGRALTSGDVVASLERARDPRMAGDLGTAGLYQSYLGGAAIEAPDARTVRLVTAEPMADLLDLLVEIPIVSRHDLPGSLTGSGPYRLAGAGGGRAEMEAFEAYWGGRPGFDRVDWWAEPDPERRVEALLAGAADLAADLTPHGCAVLSDLGAAEVVTRPSSTCVVFMCNAQSGACADPRVRRALNLALDVGEIVRLAKLGMARPLNGPLTPLHLGCDPDLPPYPHDPAAARALLAEAGHGGGLSLVLDAPRRLPDEAELLAEMMADAYSHVGVETEIRLFDDRPGYAEMVKAKRIDDACAFDSSPLSTWRVLREKFHSGVRGAWWQGYSNPRVDALLDAAAATPALAPRRDLYRRAYRLIRDDAPWIFLYSPMLAWGAGPRAAGLTPGVDGVVRLGEPV